MLKSCLMVLLVLAADTYAIKSRIIGGNDAHPSQYGYSAAIYRQTAAGNFFCSGTLLSSEWVITTASCIDNAISLTIYLGTTERENLGETGIRLSTDTYEIHPDYDRVSLKANIGLIRFRQPITFTDYIKAVEYLPVSDTVDGVNVVTYGWGQTSDETTLSDKLQWASMMTLSNDECRLTYGQYFLDDMICAEGNFNEGTCNGDIGSPMIQYFGRGNSMLVAISSFVSASGCESTDPSGFTRIFEYVGWVKNVTGVTS